MDATGTAPSNDQFICPSTLCPGRVRPMKHGGGRCTSAAEPECHNAAHMQVVIYNNG